MKYKVVVVVFISLLGLAFVHCAPSQRAMPACLPDGGSVCEVDSGPVCGIDASGMPLTFENRCMAMLAYCRFGSYFVEVKPGEC